MSNYNIYVVSKSIIVKKGISSIIDKYGMNKKEIYEVDSFSEVDYSKEDLVILYDTNEDNFYNLEIEFRENKDKAKFVVLDLNKNMSIFSKTVNIELDAYVSDADAYPEILFAIYKVHAGGKYYPGELICTLKNNKESFDIEDLTPREKEILIEMGKGKNNKDIAETFYITEHTVKKHIRNIFAKLNFADRTQAALYISKLIN